MTRLRAAAENLLARLNLKVIRSNRRHLDFLTDINRLPLARDIQVIFDIGANIGESSVKYRHCFPNARIEAFEPIPATFETLKGRVNGFTIGLHQMALGSSQKTERVILQESSVLNSLVYNREKCNPENCVDVRVSRLDTVCDELGIEQIDVMKVDTEGYEMEVFSGAGKLLEDRRIHLIYCEAGFYSLNTDFVDLFKFLTAKGYLLYGFYEQATAGKARLDHFNCLFISPDFVDLRTKLSRPFRQRYDFPSKAKLHSDVAFSD